MALLIILEDDTHRSLNLERHSYLWTTSALAPPTLRGLSNQKAKAYNEAGHAAALCAASGARCKGVLLGTDSTPPNVFRGMFSISRASQMTFRWA